MPDSLAMTDGQAVAPVISHDRKWKRDDEGQIIEARIRRPDNFHTHAREPDTPIFRMAVDNEALSFGRSLYMPNLHRPVRTGDDVREYLAGFIHHVPDLRKRHDPRFAIMLGDDTTPDVVRKAKDAGALAAKLYPAGATTNSRHGVAEPLGRGLRAVYRAMADCGLVLCVHAEHPEAEILEREQRYLPVLDGIREFAPGLKLVVEHITTAEAAEWVALRGPDVAATITPHHLVCTLDDVIGRGGFPVNGVNFLDGAPDRPTRLRPHNYCLPVPKTRRDRAVLLAAAGSNWRGIHQFFLGTDSAPHPRPKKLEDGCAGVCMPGTTAIAYLAWAFAAVYPTDWPMRLEHFASLDGARFYGLEPNPEEITLVHGRRELADVAGYGPGMVVPFAAGCVIPWRVERI